MQYAALVLYVEFNHAGPLLCAGNRYKPPGITSTLDKRYEGVQEVRRLTQLITSYFVTFQHSLPQLKCTWFSVSPKLGFRCIEELLILFFQPAICRAYNVSFLKIVPFHGNVNPI